VSTGQRKGKGKGASALRGKERGGGFFSFYFAHALFCPMRGEERKKNQSSEREGKNETGPRGVPSAFRLPLLHPKRRGKKGMVWEKEAHKRKKEGIELVLCLCFSILSCRGRRGGRREEFGPKKKKGKKKKEILKDIYIPYFPLVFRNKGREERGMRNNEPRKNGGGREKTQPDSLPLSSISQPSGGRRKGREKGKGAGEKSLRRGGKKRGGKRDSPIIFTLMSLAVAFETLKKKGRGEEDGTSKKRKKRGRGSECVSLRAPPPQKRKRGERRKGKHQNGMGGEIKRIKEGISHRSISISIFAPAPKKGKKGE